MIGNLPRSLAIDGADYPICPSCKKVLRVFEAFQDPVLDPSEKWIVAICLLFRDFNCPDDVAEAIGFGFNIGEAQEQVEWFVSGGNPDRKALERPVYDWKQDEQMIFSAVNKVAGEEVREKKKWKKLHWWTFLGYFNEIGEGTFSYVVGIRHKLNKGRKLEKHEKDFLAHNKGLVKLEKPKTREELEAEEHYRRLWEELL